MFCPNCGTQNVGVRGARASCTACASNFDVPKDAGEQPRPVAEEVKPAPESPRVSAPRRVEAGRKTNTLAIVSLVAGLICCIPVVSPAVAIGCGVGALRQLDATQAEGGRPLAITGIILGALAGLSQLLGFLSAIGSRF